MSLQMEAQMLPPMPEAPDIPAHYRDVDAVAIAEADARMNAELERSKKKNGIFVAIYAAAAVCMAVLMLLMPDMMLYFGALLAVCGIAAIVTCVVRTSRISKQLLVIYDRHPGIPPQNWIKDATEFADRWHAYELLLQNARELRGNIDQRTVKLKEEMELLSGGTSLAECQSRWNQSAAAWDALSDARRDLQHAENHAQTLRSMLRTVQPPKMADSLTYTLEENDRLLAEARLKQRQLHTKLGQCQGQMEALGSEALLKARVDTLNRRIARLEDTYYALEMAQDALRDATNTLQRRFAPRIAKRAQELFGKLTGGRYSRLMLGQDLSLNVSAQDEDTLRSAQWRSDGTADQLYLALRLAVAEELTPQAPLVLDDALVRFDDERLAAAMRILQEESVNKQVILFTCQSREKQMEESL